MIAAVPALLAARFGASLLLTIIADGAEEPACLSARCMLSVVESAFSTASMFAKIDDDLWNNP